jgi:opacity protein-like surface antigen
VKRILALATITVLVSSIFYTSVYAEKPHKHDSDKATDYFMLSAFQNQIDKALSDYYKNDSITVTYLHPSQKDFVQVFQSEKGNDLGYPYVVKVTVNSSEGAKRLGTDTITFGISTSLENQDVNVTAITTKVIDFKHTAPE